MTAAEFRRKLQAGDLTRDDVAEAYNQWVETWCNRRSAATFREWIGIDEQQYDREVRQKFARQA